MLEIVIFYFLVLSGIKAVAMLVPAFCANDEWGCANSPSPRVDQDTGLDRAQLTDLWHYKSLGPLHSWIPRISKLDFGLGGTTLVTI